MKAVGPTISYTKNQHYVWRHYLDAWAQAGSFWCYRQQTRKLFPTKPKAVGNETYFYEIHKLTSGDIAFLEFFIDRAADQRLRDLNREFLRLSQRSFQIREQLQHADLPSEAKVALKRELQISEKTLGEQYHTSIENKTIGILSCLRRQDTTFYDNTQLCGDFLYFLCHQFFRTARVRKAIAAVSRWPFPGHDPRRTGNVECRIYATNVSVGLFRERRAYKIVFISNTTAKPFITGDQPVVNLLDPHATEDIELYYPLSPILAMILSKDHNKFPMPSRNATELEIEYYNHKIYETSEDQLYASDEAYLRALVSVDKYLFSPRRDVS